MEQQTAHWHMQTDNLVNAYLTFQSNIGHDGLANQTVPTSPKTPPSVVTIDVVDLFCMPPIISSWLYILLIMF